MGIGGIVGLFLKHDRAGIELGALLGGMERDPDSTGFAIYGAAPPPRLSLQREGIRVATDSDIQRLKDGSCARPSATVSALRSKPPPS